MSVLLTSKNVFDYLAEANLWTAGQQAERLEPKAGKNFNLRVSGQDGDWLIKQEPPNPDGSLSGELAQESWFYQLLADVPGLERLRSRVTLPAYFDAQNAVLVFPFLDDACDLSSFYRRFVASDYDGQALPEAIASALGESFAALHSSTFEASAVKAFWLTRQYSRYEQSTEHPIGRDAAQAKWLVPDFLVGLKQLTPELFCLIPTDALKFFRFYQRYPEIEAAIAALNEAFTPCCAVHDDPRFANFLLQNVRQLQPAEPATLKIIDWEKWRWGDPAYDLGKLLANYLRLWLESFPVSAQLDLGTALNMASVPLSAVQPSTGAIVKSYLSHFPQILTYQPNFLIRTTQFIGLGLIRQVQLHISHKHPLGNIDMAMTQVAKSLLCQPKATIPTVFGHTQAALEAGQ